MIGRLTGIVATYQDDGIVLIDVHGVGYEVAMPLGSVGRLRKEENDRVTIHIHTVVREDAFLLYGFASIEERHVFRTLIAVSNVGPKIALSILSALSVQELAQAISKRELQRLTSISGVGRKTAERLLLELKDKINLSGSTPVPVKSSTKSETQSNADMLRSALTNMGFRAVEVDRTIETMRELIDTADLTTLLREALVLLRQP